MEFRDGEIRIEKPPNDLDRLILDVAAVLEDVGIRYAAVSGYVAVVFGRARATEDIDVIVEPFDESTASALASELDAAGFWGPAMPLSELHSTLADELPVRIARDGDRVPSVEVKFATDEYDRISLENAVDVVMPDGTVRIGSLELQIAYKLGMGAQKDYEDAVYLYEILEPTLNTSQLEAYVRRLGVEDAYDRLTDDRGEASS